MGDLGALYFEGWVLDIAVVAICFLPGGNGLPDSTSPLPPRPGPCLPSQLDGEVLGFGPSIVLVSSNDASMPVSRSGPEHGLQ